MRKLNDGLDPNNPAHKIVIDINNRNEELYGPYDEVEQLFSAFLSKGVRNYEIPNTTPIYNYNDLKEAFESGSSGLYEGFESWIEQKKSNEQNGN